MSQVELAFFTRPVADEIVPGMPTPTVPRVPISRSIAAIVSVSAPSVLA